MIETYSPGKLRILISFGEMCYLLYKQGVLRKIMGYDLMFFIMQEEFLIIAERLNALVCCYESNVSW